MTTSTAIGEHFHLAVAELKPSSNLAPGRSIAAVRLNPASGQRELALLHWGLLPHWAKGHGSGEELIFARAETVAEKPTFRQAFLLRRCLIPADGFYEWKREGGEKQPYLVRLRNGHLFAFGGLWEHQEEGNGAAAESCVILTTEANELVKQLHNRMLLIIRQEHYQQWLDPHTPVESLLPLLHHYPAREMTAYPVSLKVNTAKNQDPALVEPAESQPGEQGGSFRPLFDEAVAHKRRGGW